MPGTKQRSFHYAWIVLAGCVLLSSAGTSILVNCIGVFIKPVSAALGFPRGDFALFYTCSTLATTILSPFMGNLIQKCNQRLIIIFCSIGSASMLCAYSLCSQLWQFYIAGFCCGIFTGGLTSMSISSLITRWFVEKRGLALGIAFSGTGIGAMILNPLASHLIESSSWQAAFVTLAIILISINIPVALFVLSNKPQDKGLLPLGASSNESKKNAVALQRSIPKKEAMRMSAYWLLAISMFCAGFISTGIQQHINAYLTDIGYSPEFAASIFSMVMAWLIGGKLLLGWVFDRLGLKTGIKIVCILLSLASAVFLIDRNWMPYLFAFLFGIAYTILSIPPSCMTGELFGREHYSANYGIINMFLCAGMSLGSPISAYIFDFFGSYRPAWLIYAGLALVTLALKLTVVNSVNNYRIKTENQAIHKALVGGGI